MALFGSSLALLGSDLFFLARLGFRPLPKFWFCDFQQKTCVFHRIFLPKSSPKGAQNPPKSVPEPPPEPLQTGPQTGPPNWPPSLTPFCRFMLKSGPPNWSPKSIKKQSKTRPNFNAISCWTLLKTGPQNGPLFEQKMQAPIFVLETKNLV